MDENKIAEKIAKHDVEIENLKENVNELKDTTKAINRLATSVELIAQQLTTTNEKIEKLDHKVDDKFEKMDTTIEEIKCQPDKIDAKKYREVAKYIVIFFVGAALTLVAKQIGLV